MISLQEESSNKHPSDRGRANLLFLAGFSEADVLDTRGGIDIWLKLGRNPSY